MATGHDAMLMFLHQSFMAFCEVLTAESSCWETCKTKLQQLQEQWQEKRLYGSNALNTITQYQSQIAWQEMPPEQFSKFYRFVFHICREPGRRNIAMDVAVAAWRLIMPGRFRLLDRWSAFAAASQARVVTEDTWRQVLDFSRTVHEDLSNYDPAGAWAVLLDEFVEDMRAASRRRTAADGGGISSGGGGGGSGCYTLYRGGSAGGEMLLGGRRGSSGADLSALLFAGGGGDGSDGGGGGCESYMTSIVPSCGSKRREPDVDVVTEQLSAMPLGGAQQQGLHGGHQGHCVHGHGGPHAQGPHDSSGHALPYGHRVSSSGGNAGTDSHSEALAKRLCVDRQHQQYLAPQPEHTLQHPHHHHHQHHLLHQHSLHQHHQQQHSHQQQQQLPSGVCGPCGEVGASGGVVSCSGQQNMSCSTVSGEGSEGSHQGPVGTAAMEGLQDVAFLSHHAQQHFNNMQPQQLYNTQSQHCQQRRAIKARRSGVSDIVRTAVTDALGF